VSSHGTLRSSAAVEAAASHHLTQPPFQAWRRGN